MSIALRIEAQKLERAQFSDKARSFRTIGGAVLLSGGSFDWKRIVATRVTIALLALLFGPALSATFA